MALPGSFPLSMSDINVELGRASGATITLGGSAERALAEVPSGAISMSDFLGKSSFSVTEGTPTTGTSFNVSPGDDGREFLLIHWEEGGTHRTLSSVTIGGAAATIHAQGGHTGGSTGFGVAIVSRLVSAGTQAVVLTFSAAPTEVNTHPILVTGLTNSSPTDANAAANLGTAGSLSANIDIPENGFLLAAYSSSTNAQVRAVSWSNVTEQYDLAVGIRISGAWSSGLSAETNRTVSANISSIGDSGNHMLLLSWA